MEYLCVHYHSGTSGGHREFLDFKPPARRFVKSDSKLIPILKLANYISNLRYSFSFTKSTFSKEECIAYMKVSSLIENFDDDSDDEEEEDMDYILNYGFVDENNFKEIYFNKELIEFIEDKLKYDTKNLIEIEKIIKEIHKKDYRFTSNGLDKFISKLVENINNPTAITEGVSHEMTIEGIILSEEKELEIKKIEEGKRFAKLLEERELEE